MIPTPAYSSLQEALAAGEDAIDFPCSPAFIRGYAEQGLTTDYPPEFYQGPLNARVAELEERITELEEETLDLQGRRRIVSFRYVHTIKDERKEAERKKGFKVK